MFNVFNVFNSLKTLGKWKANFVPCVFCMWQTMIENCAQAMPDEVPRAVHGHNVQGVWEQRRRFKDCAQDQDQQICYGQSK